MDDKQDGRQYRTPLQNYNQESRDQSNGKGGGRTTQNKVPAEPRPEFGILVVEESGLGITKDITVVHSDWKTGKKGPGVELYIPGPKREAVAWQAAHTYFAYDGAEMFVCNICGKDLKLSGTAGAISSHLNRKHLGIKLKMEELERRNMNRKRKRTDLPLASSSKSRSNAESSKRVPFAKDGQSQHQGADKSQIVLSKKKGVERKVAAVRAQKQAQLMYLIGEGLPFAHVESRWHKNLLETTVAASKVGAIVPHHLEVSTKEVTTGVFVVARKLRDHLKERMKGKDLCGSTNHWTSRQKTTYVSFSVQWIEDFRLESAVLAVYVLKGGGEGPIKESVLQDISTKLEYWGFGSSIKFLVSDRQRSNTNAFGWAIEKFTDSENIPCLDYLLNLVARKAFEGALDVSPGENFGEFDGEDDSADDDYGDGDNAKTAKRATMRRNLLAKARKLVDHFESSLPASDELMLMAKQLCASEEDRDALKTLSQDVSTSWWSTQIMLERLFSLREAITTYLARKRVPGASAQERLPPRFSDDEWEALEELHFMLRPLRFAQQILEGRKSISSASFVPLVIHLIYQELEAVSKEESNSVRVKNIAKTMLNKMDELFGNFASRESTASPPLGVATNDDGGGSQVKIHKAILLAHALDPRFKPLSVFPSDVQEQIWKDLLDEMFLLGPTVTLMGDDDDVYSGKEEDCGHHFRTSGIRELKSLLQSYGKNHDQNVIRNKVHVDSAELGSENWKRTCEVELKRYRETSGMEPKMDSDVIRQWWGDDSRSTMYPILWRLAQRVLSINATSTPAHRSFCASQNIAINNRCKMGTADECFHFLHENFHRLEEEGIRAGVELL